MWATHGVCEGAASAETLPPWTEEDRGSGGHHEEGRTDSTWRGKGDLRTEQRNLEMLV